MSDATVLATGSPVERLAPIYDDHNLEALKQEWTAQQLEMAQQAKFYDSDLSFSSSSSHPLQDRSYDLDETICRTSIPILKDLRYVGGMDISFSHAVPNAAVATLVVLSFPELKAIHSLSHEIHLDKPYIPSFLSMRESGPMIDLIQELRRTPDVPFPQVFIIDGNGRFHERQAGLAVVVGVKAGVPTVGVAKNYQPLVNLAHTDGSHWRHTQKGMTEECRNVLQNRGDWLGLFDEQAREYHGAAILTSPDPSSHRPIFVSPGHRISLETGLALAYHCSLKSRVPEPTRLADILSRQKVKKAWGG